MAAPDMTWVRASRWVVLAAYSLLTICTQLLWLTYAPITTQAHHVMGVSVGAVGDLAVIFPLVYVVLALPAGRWLDARFTHALSAGAALTALGAFLRGLAPFSYGWALAGQVIIAAGQPLVLNSITKVAARYFPPKERTAAISVGSMAMFLGILAAALSAGPLFSAGGMRLLVQVQGGLAVTAAILVVIAVTIPPAFREDASVAVSLRWLRGDRLMWKLAGLLFVGMGVFNAVATWLQSILSHFGHGSASGDLIGVMTVAGIAGAAVLPEAVARRERRRTMLQAAVGVTLVVFLAIAAVHSVVFIGVALFVEGFLLLAGLPVILDWSELHAGAERAGAAAGFLLLAGNLGGVVLALAVQAVIGNPYLALGVLAAVAVPGVALATWLPAGAAPATLATVAAAEDAAPATEATD
ncbi:MAG TPA: MFS transporter [Streptosporangiaceae bacterium]|nr:MFS transporter [Streptosporangiaceae bacterium]